MREHYTIGRGEAMTTKEAMRLLKEHKPEREAQLQKMFSMEYLGSGCYRRAYTITGTNLIVKIEQSSDPYHTGREILVLEKLRQKRELLAHLPQIIYSAPGILVMPQYQRIDSTDERKQKEVQRIKSLVETSGVSAVDMHYANIMQDKHGNIRLTDLGCFVIKEDRL